ERKLMVVDEAYVYNGRLWSGELEKGQLAWPGCKTSGTFSFIHNTDNNIGFIKGNLSDSSHTAGADSFDSRFMFSAASGGLDFILPVALGEPVTLEVFDLDTGERLYTNQYTLDGSGTIVDGGKIHTTKEPPVLENAKGLRTIIMEVPPTDVAVKSEGVTFQPKKGDSGEITGVDISADAGTAVDTTYSGGKKGKVRVYNISKEGYREVGNFETEADGSLAVQNVAAKAGDRLLVSFEKGEIPTDQSFTLSFSHPLYPIVEEDKNIRIYEKAEGVSGEGEEIKVNLTTSADHMSVTVKAENQYKEGKRYTLVVEGLLDIMGNAIDFKSDFRILKSKNLSHFTAPESGFDINDSVPYGGYLFVAAGAAGLEVLDVSNPESVKRVSVDTGSIGGVVRGVAIYGPDTDKKLAVIGGGDPGKNGFLCIMKITKGTGPTGTAVLELEEQNIIHISKPEGMSGTISHSISSWDKWHISGTNWDTYWNQGTVETYSISGSVGPWVSGKPVDISLLEEKGLAFIAVRGGGLLAVHLERAESTHSDYNDYRMSCLPVYTDDVAIVSVSPYIRRLQAEDATEDQDFIMAAIQVQNFGIKLLDISRIGEDPVKGEYKTGGGAVGGLDTAIDFAVDFNNDGKTEVFEKKDLLFVTTTTGNSVTVLDIGNPVSPTVFRTIEVTDGAGTAISGMKELVVDKEDNTLYVGSNSGYFMLDVTFSGNDEVNDTSGSRILSVIKQSNPTGCTLTVDTDLNLAYVGRGTKGMDVLKLGNPELKFVYLEDGVYKELEKAAPSGIKSADNPQKYPDIVYVKTHIPGGLVPDGILKVDLHSLNAEGFYLPPAGDKVNTHILNLELTRSAGVTKEDALYNRFLSDPITLTVKPHESKGTLKMLAGDWISVEFSDNDIFKKEATSYLSDVDQKNISSRKPAIRADLVDRADNFEEDKTEKPNSPGTNPALYQNVFMHSGEVLYGTTDMSVPGRGFDFSFTRTYRSQALYAGLLGWGWDFNYNRRLQELPGGDILYYDGSGRRERFKKDAKTKTYKSPAGLFSELKKTPEGNFKHVLSDRSIEYYDSFGRLARLRDRNGNTIHCYYGVSGQLTGIMDTMGRMMQLEYYQFERETVDGDDGEEERYTPESGRLQSMTDFVGRKTVYDYDANGDLITVTHKADGESDRTLSYTYASNDTDIKLSHNLLSVADPEGKTMGFTYKENTDKAAGQYIGNASVEYTIDDTNISSVDDAMTNTKNYTCYDNGRPKIISEGIDIETSFVYTEGDGLLEKVTYPRGNSVSYTYDSTNSLKRSRGNLLTITETPGQSEFAVENARTTTFIYEGSFN
ncbi:MAG: RHS repeat protein, partial [bacterium]|nr:RHS repeat protein [bacterium]